MTPRERFHSAVNYTTPDRPPLAPLDGQNGAWARLYRYFGIPFADREDWNLLPPRYTGLEHDAHRLFLERVGDDFRRIGPSWCGPAMQTYEDGTWDGMWGERSMLYPAGDASYVEVCHKPFAGVTDLEEIKRMPFPTADWFDYSGVMAQCRDSAGYVLTAESSGAADFINGIAFLRGVEQVLYDIADEDPVYLYIVEKRFEFTYEKVRRTLEAAGGLIDVVRFGEDLGTQQGPIISPTKFQKLFAPKYSSLFDLVHRHGARAMLHSCGSVRAFLPTLIDIGLDILDVVHVDAAGMEITGLHRDFHRDLVFCGTMSVQTLLPHGTPAEIEREVALRKELFCQGGIIVGPTNIMQVDMPPENFAAMCRALGSLKEPAKQREETICLRK